jgi:hypothetical protein
MADILSKPPPPFDYLDAYSWLTPTVLHGVDSDRIFPTSVCQGLVWPAPSAAGGVINARQRPLVI